MITSGILITVIYIIKINTATGNKENKNSSVFFYILKYNCTALASIEESTETFSIKMELHHLLQ